MCVEQEEEAPKKKIEVVYFSAGRVLDSKTASKEQLKISDKRKYIPADAAKEFIARLIQELDKIKKQVSSPKR